jgi:preprotein translocase subunit SecE
MTVIRFPIERRRQQGWQMSTVLFGLFVFAALFLYAFDDLLRWAFG